MDELDISKIDYQPKFSFKFIIPGFYNFYKDLSDYVTKNIYVEYFNNENNLRFYFDKESEKEILKYHEKEEILLSIFYDKLTINAFFF